MDSNKLYDIFKITFDNQLFIIRATGNFSVDLNCCELIADEIKVFKVINEKEVEADTFGETFAGYKLDAYDFACYVVASYLSNATFITFHYVEELVKELKNEVFFSMGKAGLKDDGRQIPMDIYNSSLEKLTLDLLYQVDGEEYAAYIGGNEGTCALVLSKDGSLLTDYDSFYVDAIIEDAQKPDFKAVIVTDNIREVLSCYDVVID